MPIKFSNKIERGLSILTKKLSKEKII